MRRILGKSIQAWFVPKNSRKTKNNKKTNPVRRILGKSIQDCFFFVFWVYLVFLEVFAVPSPTVQKLEATELFM